MNFTMCLEVEEGCSLDLVKSILEKKSRTIEVGKNVLIGNLAESNARFIFKDVADSSHPFAGEGCYQWKVSVRGSFSCQYESLKEVAQELESILKELNMLCAANFVFSFQYESIFAEKKEGSFFIYQNLFMEDE